MTYYYQITGSSGCNIIRLVFAVQFQKIDASFSNVRLTCGAPGGDYDGGGGSTGGGDGYSRLQQNWRAPPPVKTKSRFQI